MQPNKDIIGHKFSRNRFEEDGEWNSWTGKVQKWTGVERTCITPHVQNKGEHKTSGSQCKGLGWEATISVERVVSAFG